MESGDYRGEPLLSEGILSGVGISLLIHVLCLFLALLAWRLTPQEQPSPPLCTVSLLAADDLLGGMGGGEEGAAAKGNGEPAAAGSAETLPDVPQPEEEAIPEPEPERPEVVHIPEKIEAPPPAPKPEEKPKEKPREKPRTVPKPKPVRQTAKAESRPVRPLSVEKDGASTSPMAVDGKGTGTGSGDTEGTGKGKGGEGPGAGSGTGSGSGAGQGPLDASFGSGDGPRFLSKAQPRYPKLARELGKEGTVVLRLTIDERGRLLDVQVLKPAGAGFDEEAVRSIRSSSFSPARRNGKPVLCRAHLPIRFVLRGTENN